MLIPDALWLRRLFPPRNPDTHKGDYGRALLLCGSVGFTGAAYFAAQAAVRGGAGLVSMGVPKPVYPIVADKLDEAMVFPLPAKGGTVSRRAYRAFQERALRADAVLIGCGLGRSEASPLVRRLVSQQNTTVILDADGINAFEKHIDELQHSPCNLILTPHDGELTRLLGQPICRDGESREDAALRLARHLNVVLVMKGHRTLIAAPDGRIAENHTGNPGMARGGSGDVLAGLICAFCAQGLDGFDAATAAVYLHGLAGDLAAERFGEMGMTPSDMLTLLPEALFRCRGC